MTSYRFIFSKKDLAKDIIIIENRLQDLDGHKIRDIEHAVDVGYDLAQKRGWYLERVEQL